MQKKFVGVDKAHGEDEGVIVEGYWLNGVYTVTKEHRLTKRAADGATPCAHDFAVTDDVFDYCIHCGEQRPAANASRSSRLRRLERRAMQSGAQAR